MKWPEFTENLIRSMNCPEGKDQKLFYDGACPGLGVRVTRNDAKSFIFESNIRRAPDSVRKVRMTIGDVRSWSIEQAREVACRYRRLTDMGKDPRDFRA